VRQNALRDVSVSTRHTYRVLGYWSSDPQHHGQTSRMFGPRVKIPCK